MQLRPLRRRLLFSSVLALMLARVALACLSIAPVTPASADECCRHSCQHQYMQDGMEQCCRQQHNASTQPPVLSVGKSAQTALDAGVMLADSPFITPSAVAELAFVGRRYCLGRLYTPPPLYVLHTTLRI